MKRKYTEQDLCSLITEVEVEFEKHFKPELEGEAIKKNEEVAKAASPEEKESSEFNDNEVVEIENLYGSMTKAEAEVHYRAVKKAVFAGEVSPIEKSEVKTEAKAEVKTEENKLLKSEVETLKSENEELKKSFGKFTEILSKMFVKEKSAPKQKAVTEIAMVKKSEEESTNQKDVTKLSPSEINTTLISKIRSGKLEKNDSDKISKYFETKSVELIKHLL